MMNEKYIFSLKCLTYFHLMWNMFIFHVTYGHCPEVFRRGYIQPTCSRIIGIYCNYYCKPAFVKTGDMLLCGSDGNWWPDPNLACIKSALCPLDFHGGSIDTSCHRIPGVVCNYNCYPGFVGNGSSLTCMKDGNWIPDTGSLCIKTGLCPDVFDGGYLEPSCSRFPGYSCEFFCDKGFVKNGSRLTCWKDGKWVQDTNSICIKSVSSPTKSSEENVGAIVGTTIAALVFMMILAIVVWIYKRVRRSRKEESDQAGGRCRRPRQNRDQNVTTLRQQLNEDGINDVSSFEAPSYNDLYVYSLVQRIPTTPSGCNYHIPPPSYSETQFITNDSPPTYKEVVTDPTRFDLYI